MRSLFTARVVGKVVCAVVDDHLSGTKLLVIRPVDSEGGTVGKDMIAADAVGAGCGELVYVARGREASFPLRIRGAPVDVAIVGIVDRVTRPRMRTGDAATGSTQGALGK